jgi:hypothetical protein
MDLAELFQTVKTLASAFRGLANTAEASLPQATFLPKASIPGADAASLVGDVLGKLSDGLSRLGSAVKAEMPDGKEFRVRAEEGELAQFPFKLEEGRLIRTDAEGEAMIGVGLQSWLGLKVGEVLRVTVNEKRTPAE